MVGGLGVALAIVLTGSAIRASGDDVYEAVRQAIRCTQTERPHGATLDCEITLPRGPVFNVNDVGGEAATFAVTTASKSDRFYVMLSMLHRCVVVGDRQAKILEGEAGFAFVSLATGKVYRTWKECGETYGKRGR